MDGSAGDGLLGAALPGLYPAQAGGPSGQPPGRGCHRPVYGEDPWKAAQEISKLIGKVPKGLRRYLPRLRFILVDINRLKPSEVEQTGNLAVQVYRLERSKSQEEVKQELLGLFEELCKSGRSEVMRAFLTWLRRVRLPSRFPELELPELRQEEKSAMLEERVRRWTEQWKAEGHQAGLREGEAATLIRQLEFKFGSLSADRRKRIRAADSNKLHGWTRRILTAARLEEVFDPADFQVQS